MLHRPPSHSCDVLNSLYDTLFSLNTSLCTNFILVGDFNIDFCNHNNPLYSKLVSVTSSFFLYEAIKEPTRHNPSGTSSTIDLAFISSDTELNTATTIPPLSTSDHLGIKLSIEFKTCHVKAKCSSRRTVWLYSKADFNKARDMIDDTDWDQIFSNNSDINHCWSLWRKRFLEIMDKCIPKAVLPKRKNLPWISTPILKAIKKRNNLYSEHKRTGSPNKLEQYKLYRNRVVSLLRSAKRAYFENLNTTDAKKFWRAMKFLNNQKSSIPNLQVNDKSVTSDVNKANVLNKHFYDNFNQSTPSLPPYSTDLNPNEFPDEILCTGDYLYELITNLDVTKSSGVDGISARMLKQTSASIVPSLTKLFNLSLRTGTFPDDWKHACKSCTYSQI